MAVMECFTHSGRPAVGLCTICQKAVCHDCVARDTPRIVCRTCAAGSPTIFVPPVSYAYGFGFGFDYKSSLTIGGWPLVHICSGFDPVTMRPRVAKGVIAIGSLALGGIAIGGAAVGLVTVGGLSLGLLFALGGAALGFGLSMGGLAVGSFAVGGAAFGFFYAIGGVAFAPAAIDGSHCDPAVVDFVRHWLNRPFPNCR